MKEAINYKKLKLLNEPSFEDHNRNDRFLVGGVLNGLTLWDLSFYYKNSADLLLISALEEKDLSYKFSYPTAYLYRHALELALKSIYPKRYDKHNLDVLIDNFKSVVTEKYNETIPSYFIGWLQDIKKIDPTSVGFRYGNLADGEYIINYHDLRAIMDEIFRVLRIIKYGNR